MLRFVFGAVVVFVAAAVVVVLSPGNFRTHG